MNRRHFVRALSAVTAGLAAGAKALGQNASTDAETGTKGGTRMRGDSHDCKGLISRKESACKGASSCKGKKGKKGGQKGRKRDAASPPADFGDGIPRSQKDVKIDRHDCKGNDL